MQNMMKAAWAMFHLSGSGYVSQTRHRDNNLSQQKKNKPNRFNIMYCYFESQVSYQTIRICHLIFQTQLTLHFCTYPSVVVLWLSEPQNEPTGAF